MTRIPPLPGLRLDRPSEGVALLVLDRPQRLNALDVALFHGLSAALEAIAGDPTVRALVLAGEGRAFSAGGDLDDIAGLARLDPEEIEGRLRIMMGVVGLLHDLPQPTIAAVNGSCMGGALGLALACDLRLAAPDAFLATPFIHMGLVPDCGVSWLLPRAVGAGPALEMMLTGRRVGAEEALSLGLVSRVCEDPVAAALELAGTFAARPAEAVVATTAMVRMAARGDLRAAIETEAARQAEALTGPEFAAGFAAWRVAHHGGGVDATLA